MEYVILIIVIAVLALGTGSWLLFVRPRRGRVSAPPAPSSLPTPSAPSGRARPPRKQRPRPGSPRPPPG